MISGAHVVIYSKDAEADRAFFRNVLGFKSVDAGHGWLIFSLPPGEAAFHPSRLRQNSMRTENSAIPCRDGCLIHVIPSPSNAKNLSRGTRAVYLYI